MPTDIGSRLRQAREQRGLTLRDIATTTKISVSALTAIEHNDFARLPGGVFRRAYVRAVAGEVGLNGDDLVREYLATFETGKSAEPLPRREAGWTARLRFRQRLPALLVTVAGVSLCGSLIVEREIVPREASDGRATPIALAAEVPPDERTPAGNSVRTEEVAVAGAAIAPIAEPLLRLEIQANEPCWVSAVTDGEQVVSRMMQPGERTLVEARVAIELRVGDASAVAYSINGVTGRPLGGKGEALTIRITSDSVDSLSAAPADSPAPEGAPTQIGRGPGRHRHANGQQAPTA